MRDYNLNRTVYSSFWDTEPPSGGSFVFPQAAMMMGGKLRHRIGAIWFTCDGSPRAYPPKPMLRGSGFNNVWLNAAVDPRGTACSARASQYLMSTR
jgi:hypothetical protein